LASGRFAVGIVAPAAQDSELRKARLLKRMLLPDCPINQSNPKSPFLIFLCNRLKIIAHIMEERIEPQVAAIPIGSRVCVKSTEAK